MNSASALLSIFAIIFCFACFVGLCVLEAVLSRKPSPVPGLVLPILSGGLSLLLLLPILLFGMYRFGGVVVQSPNIVLSEPDGAELLVPTGGDEGLANHNETAAPHSQDAPATATGTTSFLAITSIPILFVPPVVYTVIYIVCRFSRRRNPPAATEAPAGYASKAEIDKMNIQDL